MNRLNLAVRLRPMNSYSREKNCESETRKPLNLLHIDQ